MVVLDTTFIIHFLKNKQNAIEKAKLLQSELYTTRLNIFEVLVGVYLARPEEIPFALRTIYTFLQQVKILELDEKSTNEAAKLSAQLNKTGKTVADNDILIAAIAIVNGENIIVTQNVKDFSKIRGIKVEAY